MAKITILGAGNGGHAMAFYSSLRGHEVMLFEHPDFAKNLEGIKKRGGIEAVKSYNIAGEDVEGSFSGVAKIHGTTTDPKEAMDFADIIFMIVPSFAQETIFELVKPYLRDNQIFFVMPGNLASVIFRNNMKKSGVSKNVVFAEVPTIPFAVRIVDEGTIFILGIKDEIEFAVLPHQSIEELVQKLNLKLIPLQNVLAAALTNMNMIVHVPTATLSMGVSESYGGKFQFYKDGMSPSVAKVQQAVDDERMAVAKALGLKVHSFVEDVNLMYSLKMKDIRDFAEHTPIHNKFPNDCPKSPRERYISEDCPFNIMQVHNFGKVCGVKTPVVDSLITIDSVYNDEDYFETGRTLEKLGWENKTKEEILADI